MFDNNSNDKKQMEMFTLQNTKLKDKITYGLSVIDKVLNANNIYSLIKLTDTTYQLASSIPEALQNMPITLTDAGTGTLTLETVVTPPYVNLIGDIGYGKIDLNTLKVELNLINSYSGALSCYFTSLYSAIEELDINDITFNRLFKGICTGIAGSGYQHWRKASCSISMFV